MNALNDSTLNRCLCPLLMCPGFLSLSHDHPGRRQARRPWWRARQARRWRLQHYRRRAHSRAHSRPRARVPADADYRARAAHTTRGEGADHSAGARHHQAAVPGNQSAADTTLSHCSSGAVQRPVQACCRLTLCLCCVAPLSVCPAQPTCRSRSMAKPDRATEVMRW